MNASTSEMVKANFGGSFTQSLFNDDLIMPAGDYCLMIDPVWNDSADIDPS